MINPTTFAWADRGRNRFNVTYAGGGEHHLPGSLYDLTTSTFFVLLCVFLWQLLHRVHVACWIDLPCEKDGDQVFWVILEVFDINPRFSTDLELHRW